MTWALARTELQDLITGLGYTLFTTPPSELDAPAGVVVMMVPPARSAERRPGGIRRKTYEQRINVIYPIGEDEKTAAEAVDDAVEIIDDLLDGHIALAGEAVVESPISWDEMVVVGYPPGKGILYASMTGSSTIEIERATTFGA